MTSETSSIAVDIASDKDLTTRLLGAAGLPVPKQESVRTGGRRPCAAARRIGFPVVVKPLDGNHGRGVCLDLQNDDDVREAFPIAEEQSRRGVVHRRVVRHRQGLPLPDHRRPDGRDRRAGAGARDRRRHAARSRELVDLTNADPRRGVGHEKVLTRIKIDAAAEEVLAGQGHTLDSTCPPRARWSSSR